MILWRCKDLKHLFKLSDELIMCAFFLLVLHQINLQICIGLDIVFSCLKDMDDVLIFKTLYELNLAKHERMKFYVPYKYSYSMTNQSFTSKYFKVCMSHFDAHYTY